MKPKNLQPFQMRSIGNGAGHLCASQHMPFQERLAITNLDKKKWKPANCHHTQKSAPVENAKRQAGASAANKQSRLGSTKK
jgi:hypothetical protein